MLRQCLVHVSECGQHGACSVVYMVNQAPQETQRAAALAYTIA